MSKRGASFLVSVTDLLQRSGEREYITILRSGEVICVTEKTVAVKTVPREVRRRLRKGKSFPDWLPTLPEVREELDAIGEDLLAWHEVEAE